MILKMQWVKCPIANEVREWTLIPAPEGISYKVGVVDHPDEIIDKDSPSGIKKVTECFIDVRKNPDTPFITFGEAYILNDEGKTVERIN